MERNNLRRRALSLRNSLSPEARTEKSRAITTRLLQLGKIRSANHLFIYVAFRSEVETMPLIQACLASDQCVSVPLTLVAEADLRAIRITDPERQLEKGFCGIPEPAAWWADRAAVEPRQIDVVIVPGSVFDRRGGRLGYGGGYYDRFLSRRAPQAVRIALAYELQVIDRIPMQPHDQYMDLLVTENRVYDCREGDHAEDSHLQK